jgi:hypothetical protein
MRPVLLFAAILTACSDRPRSGPTDRGTGVGGKDGAIDAGVLDADVLDAFAADVDTPDEGARDADPMDVDPMDVDPMDVDPMDVDPMDVDPMDAEPMDGDPSDADPGDARPGTDATPPADGGAVDAGPDAGDGCGPLGRMCTTQAECAPYDCVMGFCGPMGRATCGGFVGMMCPPAFPECLYFTGADFGICWTQAERDCICMSPQGSMTFVCN